MSRQSLNIFALILIMGWGALPGCRRQEPQKRVEISSYKELRALFKSLGYTYETWHAGMRAVPRSYVIDVPEKWSGIADQVTIRIKKEIFYSALLPIVLHANELVLTERMRIEPLAMKKLAGEGLSPEDEAWLQEMSVRYDVFQEGAPLEENTLNELLLRVDTVPPSLALAQAAYESAYATSRFAGLGNALFGQWTYKGDGIRPKKQRKHLGDYKVAAFETPLDSTLGYIFNLNTNKAYRELREERARFRRQGKLPDPIALAGTLTRYSERGEDYTRAIQRVIQQNELREADLAYLRDMAPLLLVPVKP